MFFIKADELRKALREIEVAEKNGFNYCNAVLIPNGTEGAWVVMGFSDLWEKAHPTDPKLNWGRCQSITKRFKFIDGKLKSIKKKKP